MGGVRKKQKKEDKAGISRGPPRATEGRGEVCLPGEAWHGTARQSCPLRSQLYMLGFIFSFLSSSVQCLPVAQGSIRMLRGVCMEIEPREIIQWKWTIDFSFSVSIFDCHEGSLCSFSTSIYLSLHSLPHTFGDMNVMTVNKLGHV